MRKFNWSMLGLLAIATMACAQGVPPPAGQENLEAALRGWEKSMTELKSFYVQIERTDLDKSLGAQDMYKGYALFLKAANKNDGSRARLELYRNGDPKAKNFEKYIVSGQFLYEYSPATQKVRIHDMPQNKLGGPQQESFLSFLFGMGAAQAKARYDMEYVIPKTGLDKTYHYLRLVPKQTQDKADFTEARLTLYRSNSLPAQIWYHAPNGNESTWNFKDLRVDLDIPLANFQPDLPKSWEWVRVPPRQPANANADLKPTIRNQSK